MGKEEEYKKLELYVKNLKESIRKINEDMIDCEGIDILYYSGKLKIIDDIINDGPGDSKEMTMLNVENGEISLEPVTKKGKNFD